MALKELIGKAVDHALTLGVFERVNGYEPKSAPGSGLTAAIWSQEVSPVQSSGLASTSVRVELNTRIYSNMLAEPQDAVDPTMLDAVDLLCAAYSAGFTLGGAVRKVDLLGSDGVALSAKAGYITQDGRIYRVMTITLPLIVNDLWTQTP